MKSRSFLPILLLLIASIARAQTSDFPGANDFRVIARPANSFIIGAMHIDNDEYAVPLGSVEWNADHLDKSLTATGPVDTLAYAGPTTASSLTTYTGLVSQLTSTGYSEVWSCARKTCGSAFHLAMILDGPLNASIHQGQWGFWINEDLNATNSDIRYGTFRKGAEYVLVMASLSPGKPSGALLIRVNGAANDPVLTQPESTATSPQTTSQPIRTDAHRRIRSAARSLFKQVPP